MRKVLLLVFGMAVCDSPALALVDQVKIELRSVQTKPDPGLSGKTFPGVSQPVVLDAVPVLTNADIVYTQAITHEGERAVGITFNKTAAERFCDFTGARIGTPLGVLVDGKLVNVAPIPHPICEGMLTITGKFSVEEAKRIASAFPDGPADALKANSVWQGTGGETSAQSYPMVLFISHRWGEDFEGSTWYPSLGSGLIKVSGRIEANGFVTLSEDGVISGEASGDRPGVVAGGKYTARLEKNTLTGNGKYPAPKTKEAVAFGFILKLAGQ